MMSDCAPWVKPSLGFEVGGVGFFGGAVHPEPFALAIEKNSGSPPVFVLADAKQAGCQISGVSGSLVLGIGCPRDIPKVGDAVICPQPIEVVNLSGGPFAKVVQPRQPMLKVRCAVDSYPTVSEWCGSASAGALADPLGWLLSPMELARFWVVVQKFAQALRGKICLSHDAVLSQIGQKLTRVSARGGLRYFSLEQA